MSLLTQGTCLANRLLRVTGQRSSVALSLIRSVSSMAEKFVDDLIKSKKVVVFSKTYCPFCTKAKKALASVSVKESEMEVIELDNRGDCGQVQDYLRSITGARSVPRVFIGGECIGGGDETAAMQRSGELEKRLQTIGAL